MIRSTRQFGVFAKYWQPGQVKTRLAATEGPQRAAELYKAFLTTSLRRFEKVAARRLLGFTPRERRADFAALAGRSWHLEPQSEGDLGRRMRNYFAAALSAGFREVLLVGSDSPTLPLELIDQAFAALQHHEVVLGPTSDGGYYLIGVARHLPEIFDGIAWGTSMVWQQTVARLHAADVPVHALEPWYDVDDSAALERLSVELQDSGTSDPALLALREVVSAVC